MVKTRSGGGSLSAGLAPISRRRRSAPAVAAAPPKESKYWRRKQCLLRHPGHVWDRKTEECRPSKRSGKSTHCRSGTYWNSKKQKCQRRGKLVEFTDHQGKQVKFYIRRGASEKETNIKRRRLTRRHNCFAHGGRPWYKNGRMHCAKGEKIPHPRKIGPRRESGKF